MKTRIRTRISLLLVVAMLFSLLTPVTMLTVAGDNPPEDEKNLVWEVADFNGATTIGAGSSNRNIVVSGNDETLGFGLSTSTTSAITFVDGYMKYSPASNYRIEMYVKDGGTPNSSDRNPSEAGFVPTVSQLYRLEFDAELTPGGDPLPKCEMYLAGGTRKDATRIPGTSTYYYEFIYTEGLFANGNSGQNWNSKVFAALLPFNTSSPGTVYLSKFKIFEILCPVCHAGPCVCPCAYGCPTPGCKGECRCETCRQYPCEYEGIDCDECGNPFCQCRYACLDELLVHWDFNNTDWDDDLPKAVGPQDNPVNPGGLDALANYGANAELKKSNIYRHHDVKYFSGVADSGNPYNNSQDLKHMDVADMTTISGTTPRPLDTTGGNWLRTGGWSTAENYIYMSFNTTGCEDLILTYDLFATSTSTPAALKLQYSYDRDNWIDIDDFSTRDASGNVSRLIKRREHLPVAVYNKEEVYIRWFGQSNSTSGRLEFRNIQLVSNSKNANPPDPVETTFTHINLAPGKNATEIGFAWFTPKGCVPTTDEFSILQIAKAADLVDGKMPSDARKIYTKSATGSSRYDTNKVTATNLAASTEYAYQVGYDTGTAEEWSKVYKFNTQNPNGKHSVMVVGDPQVSGSDANWKATLAWAAEKQAKDAAFILTAGDHTEDANNHLQAEGYSSPNELRSYPVAAAYGNHDHQMSTEFTEKIRYLPLMYNWPDNMKRVQEAGGFDGFDYYFVYGDVLYIMLDSNIKNVATHRPNIQAAVNAHPDTKWRVAVFHHDIYGGSRHAGSYYGDSAQMQKDWSPLMSQFDIDIVYNGHDHLYARSYLYENNAKQKNQMTATFDQDLGVKSPSAVVLPKGTQYFALATPGSKFYPLEEQEWIAYAEDQSSLPEFTVMTIDGDDVVVDTYRRTNDEDFKIVESMTLRKKATRDDLEKMIPGAKAITRGSITDGWDDFQAAIAAAELVVDNAAATDDQIHNIYTNVYEKYFTLTLATDRAILRNLITDVTNKLKTSKEGLYAGQYARGSKAILEGVLKSAVVVNEKRYPTVEESAEAVSALQAALATFNEGVSTKAIPWKSTHTITETGNSTVDLIGWMTETKTMLTGDGFERYDSNLTKKDFAKDSNDGQRTDPSYGPYNASGGRGNTVDGGGHISKTHIGQWIRYELDVEKEGSYEIKLGARNEQTAPQTIFVRDINQNILSTFVVPPGHESEVEWADAELVTADKEIYLAKGKNVIELYFKNNGLLVTNNGNYTDGADVDILSLTRKGDGTAPAPFKVNDEENGIYYLTSSPLPPLAGSTSHSQRGWGSRNYESTGNPKGDVPERIMKAATHLVLELAGDAMPTGNNLQLVVQTDGDGMNWRQTDIKTANLEGIPAVEAKEAKPRTMYTLAQEASDAIPAVPGHYNAETGNIEIFFSDVILAEQAEALKQIETDGWIAICYYSTGWNELNVMRAYLKYDKNTVEPPCPRCGDEKMCSFCPEHFACDKLCPTCKTCGLCTLVCEFKGTHPTQTTGGGGTTPPPPVGVCKKGPGDSACMRYDCDICNKDKANLILGDILGNGDITIFDAMEILMYLVKVSDCVILKGNDNVTAEQALKAAIISKEGIEKGEPTIFCFIEILLYLVKMPDIAITGEHIAPAPPKA
ncbi:MAG: fibronectin type III domain-containing protein [Oscillospiraceae bacterium]|nr:fibronectin type III domain-containing protein [Oscillospiraceae bacterium]